MGDVAEMIDEGILCQFCGVYLGEDMPSFKGYGYPKSCSACKDHQDD